MLQLLYFKGTLMFYGMLILLGSMIIAVLIRMKKCKTSCLLKKVLPYIILLIGGIAATYVVMLSKL